MDSNVGITKVNSLCLSVSCSPDINSAYHCQDVADCFESEVEAAIGHLNKHLLNRLVTVVVWVNTLSSTKLLCCTTPYTQVSK